MTVWGRVLVDVERRQKADRRVMAQPFAGPDRRQPELRRATCPDCGTSVAAFDHRELCRWIPLVRPAGPARLAGHPGPEAERAGIHVAP